MGLDLHYHMHPDNELVHVIRFDVWGKNLRGMAMEQRLEIRAWCHATFGNPTLDMHWHDDITFGKIMFLHESDAMLFLARWS